VTLVRKSGTLEGANDVQKVLVPVDGSSLAEQVLPYAGFLAKIYGIPIELVRVDDPDVRTPFWPALADKDYLKEVAVNADRLPCGSTVRG
jgi:nucleotide-binding universal stress UspA family protein